MQLAGLGSRIRRLSLEVEAVARRLRACMERFDADLHIYTTPIAIDDLNQVRESPGLAALSLLDRTRTLRTHIVGNIPVHMLIQIDHIGIG